MSTFFMFGKYSADGIREISGKRTAQVRRLIDTMGGEIREIYALLGEYDLVFVVDFPTMTDAMKAACDAPTSSDVWKFIPRFINPSDSRHS